MTRTNRRLLLAFILSLLLHALPFLPTGTRTQPVQKALPPLVAELKPLPLPTPAPILPPPVAAMEKPEEIPPPPPPKKSTATPIRWENAVRQQMQKLKASGRYYSREAIELGLEGEPVVRMMLDADGNVSAARIEESSGHPILDRDALNAVRSLRYLPADAPRDVLLPLRYRIKG